MQSLTLIACIVLLSVCAYAHVDKEQDDLHAHLDNVLNDDSIDVPPEADCGLEYMYVEYQDLSDYSGEWYLITHNGVFTPKSDEQNVQTVTDSRLLIIPEDEKTFTMHQVARVGSDCVTQEFKGKGAQDENDDEANKYEMSGNAVDWSSLGEHYSLWVIWTDGASALIYSCSKVLEEDGSCDPNNTYSFTINRSPEGHSEDQEQDLNEEIIQHCMMPEDFIEMKRESPCQPFDEALIKEAMAVEEEAPQHDESTDEIIDEQHDEDVGNEEEIGGKEVEYDDSGDFVEDDAFLELPDVVNEEVPDDAERGAEDGAEEVKKEAETEAEKEAKKLDEKERFNDEL